MLTLHLKELVPEQEEVQIATNQASELPEQARPADESLDTQSQ